MQALIQADSNAERLVLLIKGSYWVALFIIAGMAMASFLLLQQMMADHQRDEKTLALIGAQKALSQRVVFLASATASAPDDDQRPLVEMLKDATSRFEKNYDQLLVNIDQGNEGGAANESRTVEKVLFKAPFHLDYFSTGLAANSWRFISAVETGLDEDKSRRYLAGPERARLDETMATATLDGYEALGEGVDAKAQQRLSSLLTLHRTLFFSTIAIIIMVALFIFRPLSEMILRRTRQLIDTRNSMAFIAEHDGLTGLFNRGFLTENFPKLLKLAEGQGEKLTLVQLDLDRFKQINDMLGHGAGDQVLVVTAERMRSACRSSDICVRLGGDEFVVLLRNAGSQADIERHVEMLLGALNRPMGYRGATILPCASAGIASFPDDAIGVADLTIHADLALYAAKKAGGGRLAFFSEDMRSDLECRNRLERDIRVAIAEKSFDVFFQPQVSLSTGRTVGMEALVRWQHPTLGSISPAGFLPIAEKTGLMVGVGRIILEQSLAEAAAWHRDGIPFGRLAVNVTGSELHSQDFAGFLFETLERVGLPAAKLSLEIVESVILDDEKAGIAVTLRKIREAGVHLELDDFGTGYASLTHVNPREIDRLKIDRRFVQNIDADGDNAKIVKAVIELASGLGIAVVAEGAETQAELETLMSLGCDHVQGYSIAYPMPAGQAREWLAARRPRKQHLNLIEGKRA